MTEPGLANQSLTTYKTGTPPMIRKEVTERIRDIPAWTLDNGQITKVFSFANPDQAVGFVTETLLFAKEAGHIPDISLTQGRHVRISWFTYPAGGLTMNDFIMAAKLDAKTAPKKSKTPNPEEKTGSG
ncbi:MAG: 4a-hydroxytetrahydrobiopterin dehydratase [Methanoregulaceae archaeon]